jgi:hypothetical protein
MFAPIVAICVIGGDCTLLERSEKMTYKTHEECVVETTKDIKEISDYLLAKGVVATVGFKCEENKDSV